MDLETWAYVQYKHSWNIPPMAKCQKRYRNCFTHPSQLSNEYAPFGNQNGGHISKEISGDS